MTEADDRVQKLLFEVFIRIDWDLKRAPLRSPMLWHATFCDIPYAINGVFKILLARTSLYLKRYLSREPKPLRKRMTPNVAAAEIRPNTTVGFSGESTHPDCA